MLALLGQPQPEVLGEERWVCFGETRAFFVHFQGFSLCLGSGCRVDQFGLPIEQQLVMEKPYSQFG